MTGESTSPLEGERNPLRAVSSARQEWLRFADFVRRPRLPAAIAGSDDAVRGTLRMLALDLAIMTAFILVLFAIVAAGFELPENVNASLELNLVTVALVVLAAPFFEELFFRSWLSGKPAAFFSVLILLAAVGALAVIGAKGGIGPAVIFLAGLLGALIALVLLWNKPQMAWFARAFPLFFWLSAAAFALVHLLNFPEEGVFWLALPLVLPQFVLGAIAGYVRVHYGLAAAIVLHGLHNSFALAVAALAMDSSLA